MEECFNYYFHRAAVRNFELTNDCPFQEPVIFSRGVQKKYIFAFMVSEARLAF